MRNGKNDKFNDRQEHPLLIAAGRLIGFLPLASIALIIVAGVALLPAYARLVDAQKQRDRIEVKNQHDAALTVAYDRLIESIPNDPILVRRLVRRQFGFLPENAVTIPSERLDPSLVSVEAPPVPERGNPVFLAAAQRLKNPTTRTFLLLIAIAAMTAAMILSAPPKPSTIHA